MTSFGFGASPTGIGATAAAGAQAPQAAGAGAQQVARGAQQVGAGAAQTGAGAAQVVTTGAQHDGATGAQQSRRLVLRNLTLRTGAQLSQPPQPETTTGAGAAQPPHEFPRENKPASAEVAASSNAAVAITNPRTIIHLLEQTPRSICKTPSERRLSPGGYRIIHSCAGVHAKERIVAC